MSCCAAVSSQISISSQIGVCLVRPGSMSQFQHQEVHEPDCQVCEARVKDQISLAKVICHLSANPPYISPTSIFLLQPAFDTVLETADHLQLQLGIACLTQHAITQRQL